MWRRFQESLNIMRKRGFQIGEGGQLRGQTPRETWPSPRTNHVKRLRSDKSARRRERAQSREEKRDGQRRRADQHRREGRAPGKNCDSGSRESGKAASGQQA